MLLKITFIPKLLILKIQFTAVLKDPPKCLFMQYHDPNKENNKVSMIEVSYFPLG